MTKIQKTRDYVVCADGFTMSVQASENHYCSPRANGAEVIYGRVEIGYPSEHEPEFDEYVEKLEHATIDWTGSVYGWVPADIVALVIAKHGGMVSGQIPKLGYINRIPIMKGNSNEV